MECIKLLMIILLLNVVKHLSIQTLYQDGDPFLYLRFVKNFRRTKLVIDYGAIFALSH